MLDGHGGFRVVGDFGTRATALAHANHDPPQIILLDVSHEGELWVDAISPLLTAAGPQARLLLVTALTDPDIHRQAVQNGARGIVGKDRSPDTLFKAIQKVHEGELWIERRIVAEFVANATAGAGGHRARIESLTRRERDVVRLVAEGLKNKQIAERLAVADVTVRHHLTSIFAKLEVADRLSLLVFAFKNGLVPAPDRHKRA
jgi:DNA-binding NarL/FixJ family response regulator